MSLMLVSSVFVFMFFISVAATSEIYTLPLHDALPICNLQRRRDVRHVDPSDRPRLGRRGAIGDPLPDQPGRLEPGLGRSEEHTSELQSHVNLVCRLLLEKKKKQQPVESDGVALDGGGW